MTRFFLSREAEEDLDAIVGYLRSIPSKPARRIGTSLRTSLDQIAAYPLLGHLHEPSTSRSGEEIRTVLSSGYLIFYAAARHPVLILGILHGKRDVNFLMRARLE